MRGKATRTMPPHVAVSKERQDFKDECTHLALATAGQRGLGALAATAVGIFAANTLSPAFRTSLGTSGKAALVVTPAFFTFFYVSQTTMNNCVRGKVWTEDPKTVEAGPVKDK